MTIDESVGMIMKGPVVRCAAFGHMYHSKDRVSGRGGQ